jgi:REP element-mobilizing transposase RayT
MASHIFHELFIHLNWHTKEDQALLSEKLEPQVHQFIKRRCIETKGVYFYGIGGTATHVHLVIQIEPLICISDLVGELKGACSREMNARERYRALEWQRGFGVVSFGKKQMGWVLEYVANQKEHHRCGNVMKRLEMNVGLGDL